MQYFVVMIDYGRRGREAIVDPELTRREVVSRIASGEYTNVSFIHEIAGCSVEDVTDDILSEAALPEIPLTGAELQANTLDHVRDLRKQSLSDGAHVVIAKT
ncbi:hypothetical protein [Bradyrhizobium macuxiense]|nr:hypothetical protein [Bradyrhizobium macuxiense]